VTDGNSAAAIRFMLMAMALDRALRAPITRQLRAFRSSFQGHRQAWPPTSA
jgi:hypothetical protein